MDPRPRRQVLDWLAFLLVVGVIVLVILLLLLSRSTGPTGPTAAPTLSPTGAPSVAPTKVPTGVPTIAPTGVPSVAPTAIPTATPTRAPTRVPTAAPTTAPTRVPTAAPTTTDRYVFVTRGVYNGDLGEFNGSNATCRAEAALSNLTFISNSVYPWRSMLGTVIGITRKREDTVPHTYPIDRFTNPGVLYKLPSGTVISTSFAAFFSDSHDAPLLEDQYGVNGLGGNLRAWTGWYDSVGPFLPDGSCFLWESLDELNTGAIGDLTSTGLAWHEFEYGLCNETYHLICVQD